MNQSNELKDIILPLILILVAMEYFPDILGSDEPEAKKRKKLAEYPRCSFDELLQRHSMDDHNVTNTLRMSRQSFDNLVLMLGDDLKVDETFAAKRGGALSPEFSLFFTLRYLAGARYQDICWTCKASPTAVYAAIEKTMLAIIKHPELAYTFPSTVEECEIAAAGFENISYNSAITNCVGAIDGFLMPIKVPSKSEVSNVSSYYSGHYARYGLNIQAICDAQCRFIFLAASAPGSTNDRVAYEHCGVGEIINKLPLDYAIVADAAYGATEHCLPMYYGTSRKVPKYDNYNFYASQLRIRIEMAFGMMTRKWLILDSPVKTSLKKAVIMIQAISRLHNYCINERLKINGVVDYRADDRNSTPTVIVDDNGMIIPATSEESNIYRSHGHSINREIIANNIARRGLVRLTKSPWSNEGDDNGDNNDNRNSI